MNIRRLPMFLEKRYYPFRRYPRQAGGSLLFAGCYFPAFFPRTMRTLCTLAAAHDTVCAFDCCGKPLADLKRETDAKRVISRISGQLQRLQARELITVCPNCHVYLQQHLDIPVVSIYERLGQWGITVPNAPPPGHIFIPCPDRAQRQMLGQIGQLTPLERLQPVKKVPCCGLGGGGYERDKQRKLAHDVQGQLNGPLYTYCASCAGQFQRQGLTQVSHMLALLLDTGENPDIARSLANRWQFKKEIT